MMFDYRRPNWLNIQSNSKRKKDEVDIFVDIFRVVSTSYLLIFQGSGHRGSEAEIGPDFRFRGHKKWAPLVDYFNSGVI